MKNYFLFLILLFCSCTTNEFYGHVYDYDTEKPIKDVFVEVNGTITKTDSSGCFSMKIKSDTDCVIVLQKEEYAIKKITRKPDSLGMFSKTNLKNAKIYLLKKESDFSSKM